DTLLARYGPNQLQEKKGRGPFRIFLEQFEDLIIWVLIGAAIVSGFLKEWVDALAILAIVILNAILGLIQEYRAEKSLAALKKLSAPTAKAVRAGVPAVIPAGELVPGDLIELEAGDHIPADSRIIGRTSNFAVQEASLTGESTPVMKTDLVLDERDVPLADRANIVYLGTSVVAGKARAVVVETGMQTELGRIAGLIQETKKETTPLQRRLEQFGKWLVYLCFGLVALVFLLELIRGGRLIDVFLTSVSLAVAAIPEGLPAVVTIALALGVQRMVKRHVLIRKLPSVESLGCATVICSDKTGTLTKNEMTVQVVWTAQDRFEVTGTGYAPQGEFQVEGRVVNPHDYPDLIRCLTCGILCNNAQLDEKDGEVRTFGDPTEVAILSAAAKAGLWKPSEEATFELVEEIPFDSERKKMTVVRKSEDAYVVFTKGAPDLLLADCTTVVEGGAVRALTDADRQRIQRATDVLSGRALRVLAVAYRDLDAEPHAFEASVLERDLTFAGLVAMIDPARPEARDAVEKCRTSGIRSVMITGDHKNTAVAIARDLGIFGEGSLALTGEELDRLPEESYEGVLERVPVYARVSPEHKLRAVRAWRRRGEIVAMTGDGVNDAPAVREADIGVAMGITGTDVTKEVSDMVITDDNFASIVAAVEEGRGIYDNIQKFIHYLLSCNFGEILVMFTASLLALPVPLLPIQILWVNLVTDGLPALALGVDPVTRDVMKRPPRRPDEPVVGGGRIRLIVLQGAFIALCSLAAFLFVLKIEGEGLVRARTAALAVLACSQLFHAFNCRSQQESLFRLGILTNANLVLANVSSFVLQMAIIYLPFFQVVFKTEALGLVDLSVILVFSSLPFWGMEIVKALNRKLRIYSIA
ncbi:MAG: calcium-translocating P-type ATPase, SERCA-type, partial [Candidatus Aminicenantes bacterium]|nr:calcium-translocating P-type ATPase, SERCA-type [Candidatus Aminicenantes bacterium]